MSKLILCPDCGGIVASRFSVHVCKRVAPKHKRITSWKRGRKTNKRKPCLLCGGFHK